MNDDGFILIDHELTFSFIDNDNEESYNRMLECLLQNNWPEFYKKHLFYNRLKSYKGSKKTLFDTFDESLRNIDMNKIEGSIIDLQINNIDIGRTKFS